MKIDTKTLLATTLATLIAASAFAPAAQAADEKAKDKEKCYGVAKAGKNDCASQGHSCSGQSKKDSDAKDWIYVPTGTCERIMGGSTTMGK
jgi:uncharacterized membrane protein